MQVGIEVREIIGVFELCKVDKKREAGEVTEVTEVSEVGIEVREIIGVFDLCEVDKKREAGKVTEVSEVSDVGAVGAVGEVTKSSRGWNGDSLSFIRSDLS